MLRLNSVEVKKMFESSDILLFIIYILLFTETWSNQC